MYGMYSGLSLYSGTYYEVLGTMKIMLYHSITVKKQRNIKSWDQQKLPC